MAYYKCGSVYTTQNSNVVVDTASGSVASFNTQLSLPLIETKFGVKATQEAGTPTPQSPKAISGVSAVNVVHCHKNLFDLNYLTASGITIQNGEASGTSQAFYDNFGTNTDGIKQLKFKANTVYTLSLKAYTDGGYTTSGQGIYFRINYTDGSYSTLALNNNQQEYGYFEKVSNANKTIDRIYLVYSSGYSNTWHLKDIQIEEGASASEFETYNGSTTLINLGGTYYGGYVSQDKNGKMELVVTHGVKLFSELSFGRSNNSGIWEGYRFYALVDKLRGKDVKCSHYEAFSVNSASNIMENETLIAPLGNDYIYVKDDNYTTVEAFKTANANTQLWYELAEPFTVALPDGEPIKSLPGVNNIFCDTGDTSLQFRKIG